MRRERIVGRRNRAEAGAVGAVAWLKTKRDEIGLAALATMLGVDAANLAKGD